MEQITTRTHNLGGSLASTGCTNEAMVDGNGTTTHTYQAAVTMGAA